MKKALIFAALLALLLQPFGGLAESNPIVYKVSDEQGHVIYLLGTIHVGAEEMYPLSDAAEEAYRNSDVLAVEVDIQSLTGNLLSSLKYSFALMYGLGDSAKNHFSEETYQLGVEKLGYPEYVLNRMKPAAWYSMAEDLAIRSAGLSSDWGVDNYLMKRAREDGKQVQELEGMDSQMEILLNLPDEALDNEIKMILLYPKEAGEETRKLWKAWCEGDEEKLTAMVVSSVENVEVEEELTGAYDEFASSLIYVRNGGFEEKAKEYLQNGDCALIAIGAGHILGKDGLAQRLSEQGYTVERMGK